MKNIITIFSACLFLTGCYPNKVVGPKILHHDAIHYNHAMHDSVDKQILLNMVRLRYRDNPTFLQVGVISSSYDYKKSISNEARFENITDALRLGIFPRAGVDFSEKPTTTFQPLRGENFTRELLNPVPMENLVLLNASGWRIDRILRCCVQRLNDVQNAPSASGPTPAKAPEYREFLELMGYFRQLEDLDAINLSKEKDPKDGSVNYYLTLHLENGHHHIAEKIWRILKIQSGTTHIKIVPFHGRAPYKNDELVIDTRSPLSVIYFLSQGVQVPAYDEAAGRVSVTKNNDGTPFDWGQVLDGIMTIHSAPESSCNLSVDVCYRGTRFYIDDRDLGAKSTFSMLSQLLSLQTGCPTLPTVTTIRLND